MKTNLKYVAIVAAVVMTCAILGTSMGGAQSASGILSGHGHKCPCTPTPGAKGLVTSGDKCPCCSHCICPSCHCNCKTGTHNCNCVSGCPCCKAGTC